MYETGKNFNGHTIYGYTTWKDAVNLIPFHYVELQCAVREIDPDFLCQESFFGKDNLPFDLKEKDSIYEYIDKEFLTDLDHSACEYLSDSFGDFYFAYSDVLGVYVMFHCTMDNFVPIMKEEVAELLEVQGKRVLKSTDRYE